MNHRITALLSAATAHSRKDDAGTSNWPSSESFGSLSLPWQTIAASLDNDTSVALTAYVHGTASLCPRTSRTGSRIA